MIPISRVEMYLAKICGEDVDLPIPQTRKEVFLAIIAGENYEKPVPSSRVELYLAKILGDDVPIPIPQSREEIFLAKIAGVEYPLPYPESRIEYWLHKWATYEEWSTVTGNPVSFTAKAAPLRQLQVAFSPVQSLNGYDSPWPAGGGKNKLAPAEAFTQTINGVTLSCDGNGKYTLSGTATGGSASFTFPITATHELQSGEYLHIRNSASNANMTMSLMAASDNIRYWGLSPANRVVNIQDTDFGKTVARLNIYVANGTTADMTITPSIEADSAVTTYSPYSNECPISGWSSLGVEQRGKNLSDKIGAVPYKQDTGLWIFLKAGTYTAHIGTCDLVNWRWLIVPSKSPSGTPHDASLVTANGMYSTGGSWFSAAQVTNKAQTFTVLEDAYIQISISKGSGTTDPPVITEPMIELGSTATAYTPYNPSSRSISITIGQTVYSGELDVISGVLTVDMVCETFDGNSSAVTWNANKYARIALANSADTSKYLQNKVNMYIPSNSGNTGTLQLATAAVARAWDDRFTDLETMKSLLNEQPIQYCYCLATPTTIQLTPQEVESLAGDNVLFSDANGNLTVEYRSN